MSAGSYDQDPEAIDELLSLLDANEAQLLERFRFLEFDDSDARLLSTLREALDGHWEGINEDFYSRLNAFPELCGFLEGRREKLKEYHASYFAGLLGGPYDDGYVRSRVSVGLINQHSGLSPEWYLGAYNRYLAELMPALWKVAGNDFGKFQQLMAAVRKIVFFDIGIALDTYFAAGRKALSDRKRYEEELAFQTTHDRLTGLSNRATFEGQLAAMLDCTAESGLPAVALRLRLHDFQNVNASVSHAASDRLLIELAKRIGEALPKEAILGRYDSLEFAVACPLSDQDVQAALLSKIFAALEPPVYLGDAELRMIATTGGAFYPADANNAASLLRHAGIALHYALENGTGSSLFFSAEMHRRVQLERELPDAVREGQLYLEYQPIVDLKTGRLSAVEALVRWQHPEFGPLLPHDFIPIAEESQSIDAVGTWVLEQACRDAAGWSGRSEHVRLSINISPKQLDDPLFAGQVIQVLTGTGLAPTALSLEITESMMLRNTPQSQATLEQLKEAGISLVLDDFGTGYSSLAHLKNLPVEGVKITLGPTGNVLADVGDEAIINAIVSMVHSLGMHASAVGVETEEQCAFLREHMCDEIQGFYFCPPLPAHEINAFLQKGQLLPEHLRRLHKPQRTLLLVDDEANILASLKRLFRPDGYRILTAGSGQEGLEILEKNEVDVIISDQRMPGMMGVEFLRLAKDVRANTVRIVLSGYTELQSVTDAVNEGAIYKFLTKPWEDQLLREHIAEAFRHKEMEDENQRLSLAIRTANQELAAANRKMEKMLQQKQEQIVRSEVSLDIVREILLHIAVPLIGIDESNLIVFANESAEMLFVDPILGSDILNLFPELSAYLSAPALDDASSPILQINNYTYCANIRPMGYLSQAHGKLISLSRRGESP